MKKVFSIYLSVMFLSACSDNTAPTKSEENIITVKTMQLERTNVIRTHELPAIVLAEKRADLSFLLSGKVDKVLVKIGEKVEKNQLLMSLYNPNLDPAIASNLAQLESVKVQISQAKSDVQDLRELRKNNSISKTAYERKETELKDLTAKQNAIKAQIDLANANQQESFIRAPFAAVIVTVTKQVGEFVQAGQVAVVINQPEILEVELGVTNNIHQSLKLNQIINGSYENKQVQLLVTELAQVADKSTHLKKVILRIKNKLKSAIGQEIIVHFPQVYQQVYQLPLESVVDDGINKPYVFIANNGKAQKHYIKPLFIVQEGIVFSSEKDILYRVVIKGQSKLSAGMRLGQN